MVETAIFGHRCIQRPLAGMAEGRVAEVMGERQRLGQVLVEPERAGQRPRDLRDLQGVGQARSVMITLIIQKYLGFLLQPAKGGGMDDAVAVALEGGAGPRLFAGSEA
jgi:hypothetical protein